MVKSEVKAATRRVFAGADLSSSTTRELRSAVESDLGWASGSLKADAAALETFKQTLKSCLTGDAGSGKSSDGQGSGESSDSEDSSESSDGDECIALPSQEQVEPNEDGLKKRRARQSGKNTKKRKKRAKRAAPKAAGDPKLARLHKIQRAAGVGPGVFRGLPQGSERARCLSAALKERGVVFKGLLPTDHEIAAAQAKRDLAMSLDGIDASNIVDTGSRRRNRAAVSYCEADDDDEEEEEDGGAASSPPRRAAVPAFSSSSPPPKAGDDGSESEEEEFEFE